MSAAPDSIDFGAEELLDLREATGFISSRFHAGGKRLHVSTIFRWANRGIRRVRLETVCVGARRMTSREALGRFFARLAENESSSTPAGLPSANGGLSLSARDRRAIAADRELERAGI